MLRFDVPPVWSNVGRWEAFLTTVMTVLAMWVSPWFMVVPLVQGFVRGFFGHHLCPAHHVWKWVAEKQNWGGEKENAGARMFANKLLAIASAVTLVLFYVGSPMWKVPVTVLMVFTTLEWALSFCVACHLYGFWYRVFPPRA